MDAVDDIDTVQMTESQKFGFIEYRFKRDSRGWVFNVISHPILEKWDYKKTMEAILDTEDRLMLPSHEKIACSQAKKKTLEKAPSKYEPKREAGSPKTNNNNNNNVKHPGYCNLWNRTGSCNINNCRYDHSTNPHLSTSKPTTSDSPVLTSKSTGAKPITNLHRSNSNFPRASKVSPAEFHSICQQVGYPNGQPSMKNADGWSRSQLSKLRAMESQYDDSASTEVGKVDCKSLRIEKRKYDDEGYSSDRDVIANTDKAQNSIDKMNLDNDLDNYQQQRRRNSVSGNESDSSTSSRGSKSKSSTRSSRSRSRSFDSTTSNSNTTSTSALPTPLTYLKATDDDIPVINNTSIPVVVNDSNQSTSSSQSIIPVVVNDSNQSTSSFISSCW